MTPAIQVAEDAQVNTGTRRTAISPEVGQNAEEMNKQADFGAD